jgi:hypothetical protein
MKKFTFKGVLDGFTNKTSDGSSTPKPSKSEIEETLKSSQLRGCKVFIASINGLHIVNN